MDGTTKLRALFLLAVATIYASGCGAAGILVVKSAEQKLPVASVNVYEKNSPISVPVDVQVAMQENLEAELYRSFQMGPELSIRYRFLHFDPVTPLGRWFPRLAGSGGRGSVIVEAKFFDQSENELAIIEVEGVVGTGPFKRDVHRAVEKVAEKVAEYAELNYR